ncbi:type II toxin-antitoxin system RelE/ParE family toxin [Sandarakinorhabdus sp.]|uniref:type II toxin-antitoxin system RelE/ParE family toxin n=1 Tax=Sandarakinorhabdus sp. TaxID=1916663 RepID=UPI003F721E6B
MADVTLSTAAARDLDAIFDYGADHWGTEQAATYVASFADCFALLADFPLIGTARPDVEPSLRSTPHGSHIVYFSSDARQVVIERILHSRQVPRIHM